MHGCLHDVNVEVSAVPQQWLHTICVGACNLVPVSVMLVAGSSRYFVCVCLCVLLIVDKLIDF
jgi:hypothetical protein